MVRSVCPDTFKNIVHWNHSHYDCHACHHCVFEHQIYTSGSFKHHHKSYKVMLHLGLCELARLRRPVKKLEKFLLEIIGTLIFWHKIVHSLSQLLLQLSTILSQTLVTVFTFFILPFFLSYANSCHKFCFLSFLLWTHLWGMKSGEVEGGVDEDPADWKFKFIFWKKERTKYVLPSLKRKRL